MVIRRLPEDFNVEEILRAGVIEEAPLPPGGFDIYVVTKTTLTTPEAAARLAKLLGLKPGVVGYAGLKDKHAVTRQHMSVPLLPGRQADKPTIEAQGFHAVHAGFTRSPLRSLDIAYNSFRIIIRECTRQDIGLLTQRGSSLLTPEGELECVNYFGEQRFGSARHGQGFVAARLIAGDFEGALRLAIGTPARKDSGSRRALTRAAASHWGDWRAALAACPPCPSRKALEALGAGGTFQKAFVSLPYADQEMFVDSYQSLIWNSIVATYIRSLGGALLESSNLKEDGLIFPTVAHDALDGELDLPSPKMHVPARMRASATKAFAVLGFVPDQLTIPGLRRPAFSPGKRAVVVKANQVTMAVQRDELAKTARFTAVLTFTLPSGSYATVLLRLLGQ